MQRRNFLQGLAAGAGVAAMPLPLAAKAASMGSVPYRAVGFHYGWACVYAQRNGGITAADIASKFNIPTAEANALFNRMLDRGVLTLPGLDGRSHATTPWQPWDQRHPVGAARQDTPEDGTRPSADSDAQTIADRFRAVMAYVTTDSSYGWPIPSQV